MTLPVPHILSATLSAVRITAIAALLAGAAAVPAFAQGAPSFHFDLRVPGAVVGTEPGYGASRPYRRPVCLSDREVENGLEDAGWRNVDLGADVGRTRVIAYANWRRGSRLYQMVVDRCSGQVDHVAEVRREAPVRPPYDAPPRNRTGIYMQDPHSGLGFGFSVGN